MKIKLKLIGILILFITVMVMPVVQAANEPAITKDGISAPSLAEKVTLMETPMKTIGIVGGVSWTSSLEYYRQMNKMVQNMLGGLHSARILMYSIEFGEFSKQERLSALGDWDPLKAIMIDAAQRLEKGGADFIVIASNTLNSLADIIATKVNIPIINIADATGEKVKQQGLTTVALLGTKFTMEQPFYRDRLQKYGIQVVTPDVAERDYINQVIFDELCADKINPESKAQFIRIINRLARDKGAQGVILGCTEIPLLIKPEDVNLPVFDTTAIHVEAAVRYAIADSKKNSETK